MNQHWTSPRDSADSANRAEPQSERKPEERMRLAAEHDRYSRSKRASPWERLPRHLRERCGRNEQDAVPRRERQRAPTGERRGHLLAQLDANKQLGHLWEAGFGPPGFRQ